jgi:acyl dehydratase
MQRFINTNKRRILSSSSLIRLYSTTQHEITINNHPLSTIRIGDYATLNKTFTEQHVEQFAHLVGDFNPVHFDEQYVKEKMNGIFKQRVVHGILLGGLISTLAGTVLPGPGSVYLHQTFNFLKPAYIGDSVCARVECKKAISKRGNVFLFDTTITNAVTGELLVSGEAKVYHPTLKILSEEA